MTGVTFTSLVPFPLLLGLLALGLVVALYAFAMRARATSLRTLGVIILAATVTDPRVKIESQTPLDDIVVVAVDESLSQQVADRPAVAAKALDELSANFERLKSIDVRTVTLKPKTAGGQRDGTRLFESVSKATADVPSSRLAGIILVTDGVIHDVPEPAQTAINAPIHVLLTGHKNERDRKLVIVEAPEFGLVDKTVSIRVSAEDSGLPNGTPIGASLRSDIGKTQPFTIKVGESLDVVVLLEHPGPNIFELAIDELEDEISLRNNTAMVAVNAIRDRLKVLLISGKPHLGERAWRNLLKSDPNVDLVHFTILRPLSKDDGTPLNELALISFPIRELFEEQLYDFDLIIFDRYSRRGLVPFQFMMNVASYVVDGGAIMLSVGPEYADSFSLFDSPLQDILPAAPTGNVHNEAFLPRLSAVGERHPVTAALTPAGQQDPSWGRWLRHIDVATKSGQELMYGAANRPLLMLDRVGKGRVALLLSDTIWLWGKGFDGGGPQAEMLRRLAHWLMKEPELEENSLTASAQDGMLEVIRNSLDDTVRMVTIQAPDGSSQTTQPEYREYGQFVARVPASEEGLYRIEDGILSAVVAVGAANPLENHTIIATADRLAPVVESTGGGLFWVADEGVPTVRLVAPGRLASGESWIGLRANNQYIVNRVSEIPLVPAWLALLVLMSIPLLTWWREGR
ncbi:MAG: hypothetical protein ACJZ9F_01200 [Rhodospirillaceae bacterium]